MDNQENNAKLREFVMSECFGSDWLTIIDEAVRRALETLTEREQKVIMERAKGKTYREIGPEVGLSRARAHYICRRAIHRLCRPKRVRRMIIEAFGGSLSPPPMEIPVFAPPPFITTKAEPSAPTDVREMPIEDLPCSVRLYNVLRNLGIQTIGEAADLSGWTLYAQRNCGKKTIQELISLMREVGIEPRCVDDLPPSFLP